MRVLLFIYLFYIGISLSAQNKESLVLHIPIEDTISDATKFNNGIISNGPRVILDDNPNSNSAIYFDGKDDYIEIKNKDHLNFGTADFTISFWLKYPIQIGGDAPSAPGRVFDYATVLIKTSDIEYPYRGITFFIDFPKVGDITFRTSAKNELSHNSGYNNNEWHFYTLRRKGEELSIYIDGEKKASGIFPIDNVSNDANFIIGANHTDHLSQNLSGTLRELRMYNMALSEKQIYNLYKSMN